jgi:hypothetical protein
MATTTVEFFLDRDDHRIHADRQPGGFVLNVGQKYKFEFLGEPQFVAEFMSLNRVGPNGVLTLYIGGHNTFWPVATLDAVFLL